MVNVPGTSYEEQHQLTGGHLPSAAKVLAVSRREISIAVLQSALFFVINHFLWSLAKVHPVVFLILTVYL